ncbi:hypothetical protein SDJN03_18633, partial [Cucurbita argyrosperma subsp. sororia]
MRRSSWCRCNLGLLNASALSLLERNGALFSIECAVLWDVEVEHSIWEFLFYDCPESELVSWLGRRFSAAGVEVESELAEAEPKPTEEGKSNPETEKLGLHQGKEQRSFFLIAAEKEQADQSLNVVQPSVLLIPRRNYFFQSLRPGTTSQNHSSCSASRTT